ncbi:hypothetical protein ACEU6E_02555 [Halorutilales archaeon Cl-col2-1]
MSDDSDRDRSQSQGQDQDQNQNQNQDFPPSKKEFKELISEGGDLSDLEGFDESVTELSLEELLHDYKCLDCEALWSYWSSLHIETEYCPNCGSDRVLTTRELDSLRRESKSE